MGLSEKKRRGGALQRMANGDIGVMDAAFVMFFRDWVPGRVRRWFVVFSDIENCDVWRKTLTRPYVDAGAERPAPLRYARTGLWVKPDAMPQMSGDRPAVGFEPCTICHAPGVMRWNGGGKPALWMHNTAKGSGRPEGHPCPKPEPLMRDLVLDFTDDGEIVLDPFGGSGTTGVAAKRLGRKAVLIEGQEAFAEIAAKRIEGTALEPRLLPSADIKARQGKPWFDRMEIAADLPTPEPRA
jgi:site-specific DNA-methyltransferase (adenine-specific)